MTLRNNPPTTAYFDWNVFFTCVGIVTLCQTLNMFLYNINK